MQLPLFTVVGMDRCEGEWYASDNNLHVPWPWKERHSQSMAWARHGHGMASVNQTRPHCVDQMGKTHSKPLAARHGMGTVWARHAMCESALIFRPRKFCFMLTILKVVKVPSKLLFFYFSQYLISERKYYHILLSHKIKGQVTSASVVIHIANTKKAL
jgi:hypothetical protein